MTDHLQHGAANAEGIYCTNTEQHKTHVAHGAAGNSPFDVVLGKSIQGAVDNVDDAKHN